MLIIFFLISISTATLMFTVKGRRTGCVAGGLFLISEIALSLYSAFHIDEFDSFYYKFDALGVLLSLVLSVLSVATFYHSILYHRRHPSGRAREGRYYAALIMLIASMTSAYFSENIALLWVSVEATTLFVSMLIYHERSKEAIEASWKYLFVSSVGVAIAFMGILFLSIVASKSGLADMSLHGLLGVTAAMDPKWLRVAFLLVLIGFSAKMGLFPLHTVAVDAHTAAPPPISAFISTALMNVGFLGIFRVYSIIAQTEILAWAQNVLMIAAVASIAMAAIQLFRVRHFKRMYAFSSLEHMGIVAMGLAVGGVGYYAAILQIVFHSFTKASLFYQIGQVNSVYDSYYVADTGNYFKINPLGGLVIIFGFISILALPPSGLFVSEIMTFMAMFNANQALLALLAMLLLTLIIYVVARNTLHLLYSQSNDIKEHKIIKLNHWETISQFILLGLVVYLGMAPPRFFSELIAQAVSILH